MALNDVEQREYDELLTRHTAAGGNPEDPLDETTRRLWRDEHDNQPDDCISIKQVRRLSELHRKKISQETAKLTAEEQTEYDALSRRYIEASGQEFDPEDYPTMEIRFETEESLPDDAMMPEQVDRLRALHSKLVGNALDC